MRNPRKVTWVRPHRNAPETRLQPENAAERGGNANRSAGVALFGQDNTIADVDAIMRHADIALDDARKRETSMSLFRPSMEEAIRERAELESALESAIDIGQITPHFQPVMDLAAGTLTGFEVLAR